VLVQDVTCEFSRSISNYNLSIQYVVSYSFELLVEFLLDLFTSARNLFISVFFSQAALCHNAVCLNI
jgi:hypothetical protein